MSEESREIRTMRHMAWARAKGELDSMLDTFWDNDENYQALKKKIREFTKEVEMWGLQE